MRTIHFVGALVSALAAVGCGSDDSGGSSTPGPTVVVTGSVTGATTSNPRPPLEGVTVCALDLPEVACATTDAAGKYTLKGLPANEKGALTFSKQGYLTGVVPGETEAEDLVVDTSIAPEQVAQMFAGIAELDWPLVDSGVLAIDVYDGQGNFIEGASATISPSEGTKGPIYLGDTMLPDKDLTVTSKSSVVYFQAPVGTVSLTVQHPERTCSIGGWGWASATGTLDVPIVSGASSFAVVACK
jgi:hypothetical protein